MLRLPHVLSRRSYDKLVKEIEGLRSTNERLREKLAAAQEAKVVAVKQAEDLRKGKERLRLKVASVKKSLDQSVRVNEQLQVKVSALIEANEALERRVARGRE